MWVQAGHKSRELLEYIGPSGPLLPDEHSAVARIALGLEYDGRRFHGWQSQKSGVRTVQSALEAALSKVAAHPVKVVCAGRTDAGVHASGQVVHFDTEAARELRAWVLGCNTQLPDDVSVNWARVVDDAFHARFSARARRYHYIILNRAVRSALHRGRATWHHYQLDAGRMHEAGQVLLGEHDFSAFRAKDCQSKTPFRNVHHLTVTRAGDWITLDIQANAFLHHMVRNIAGVLIAIGQEQQTTDWAAQVLAARDRRQGGVTAPPDGLYLRTVQYDAHWNLPDPNQALGFERS